MRYVAGRERRVTYGTRDVRLLAGDVGSVLVVLDAEDVALERFQLDLVPIHIAVHKVVE